MSEHSQHEPAGGGMSPFSPIFDEVARQLGMTAAAVYGVVWRHCQMREGACRASMRTLAERVGCNMSTVQRQLRLLVQQGYIQDTTPGLRNRPHTYRVTSKVAARTAAEAEDPES